MTVSSGVLGGTLGVSGVAVGGGSSADVRGAVTQLASTGAGHLADTIAIGLVLLIGGLTTLGLARRHRPLAATPISSSAGPLPPDVSGEAPPTTEL